MIQCEQLLQTFSLTHKQLDWFASTFCTNKELLVEIAQIQVFTSLCEAAVLITHQEQDVVIIQLYYLEADFSTNSLSNDLRF